MKAHLPTLVLFDDTVKISTAAGVQRLFHSPRHFHSIRHRGHRVLLRKNSGVFRHVPRLAVHHVPGTACQVLCGNVVFFRTLNRPDRKPNPALPAYPTPYLLTPLPGVVRRRRNRTGDLCAGDYG
jgi:hypothetical protein